MPVGAHLAGRWPRQQRVPAGLLVATLLLLVVATAALGACCESGRGPRGSWGGGHQERVWSWVRVGLLGGGLGQRVPGDRGRGVALLLAWLS